MIDSCKPRKLEPGLEAIYSRPRDLRTSTMKSDPDRSIVKTSTLEGSSSFGIIRAVADWAGIACGAASVEALATSPAAPAAAPFKNLRRSTESFFAMARMSFKKSCWLPRGGSYSIDVYHTSIVTGWRIDFGCDSVWFWEDRTSARPKCGRPLVSSIQPTRMKGRDIARPLWPSDMGVEQQDIKRLIPVYSHNHTRLRQIGQFFT